MDKVKTSNKINRTLGGQELLFCTRVHVQSKLWGGFWIPLQHILDVVFRIINKQDRHCLRSYIWERRYHGKTQAKADQSSAQEAPRETTGNQASETESKPRPTTLDG
jgi:hypothetical protein